MHLQEDSLCSSLQGQVTGLKMQLAEAAQQIAQLQGHISQQSAVHDNTKQKHDHLWQSQLLQQQSVTNKAAVNEQLHQQLLGKLQAQQQQQQRHMQLTADLQTSRQECQVLRDKLQQERQQHQQEATVMSAQLASTEASVEQSQHTAQQAEKTLQHVQRQYREQQALYEQKWQQLTDELCDMTQQHQQLQQQLHQELKRHADVSIRCTQLEQELFAAMHAKASTAGTTNALHSQVASVTARLHSAEAKYNSLLTQAEQDLMQQQKQSKVVANALRQEVASLQDKLAVSIHRPDVQNAATQTSTACSHKASQTDVSSSQHHPAQTQPQAAQLAELVKTLQVCCSFA